MNRDDHLLIQTPEGITFAQPLASPIARFLAWCVDFLVTCLLLIVVNVGLMVFAALSPDFALALMVLAFFVINLGYGMFFEWIWHGQTPGKRLARLRVVDAGGLRLRFSQVALRNLLRAVDLLPTFYLVGGAACLLTRRAQRLGDLAAGTVVVWNPKTTEPDLEQLFADKFNSLRRHPHLVARLRQRVTPAEAAVALRAIGRREEFDAPARLELFAELAQTFRARTNWPEELTEGLSDEQFVRNVVDVLYRSARPTRESRPEPDSTPRPAATAEATR